MKKILSVILSLVVAASVCTVSMISATAATVVASPEGTTKKSTISVEVNGGESSDVTYKTDATDPSQITFVYNGEGTLDSWSFGDLVEGVDYVIVSENKADGTITIKLLKSTVSATDIIANAIVDFTEDEEPTEEPEEEETTVNKKDDGSTSPKTGAAMTGALVAGAGVAMLAALKRKND